ncbi:MAG: hypothetical protein WBP54_06540 [Pelodictyon phaeoclathratiforme]
MSSFATSLFCNGKQLAIWPYKIAATDTLGPTGKHHIGIIHHSVDVPDVLLDIKRLTS